MRCGVRFEWDPAKEQANRIKHGLSSQDAVELLSSDTDYLEIYDEAHSVEEERFIAVGPVRTGIIVVVYTVRDDEIIRILSARMATRRERKRLSNYWRGGYER
jgi:uncharacterized DUF497 family protein